MNILVIGANGKDGRLLLPLLAEAVVADLQGEFEHALEGRDAVVFPTGSRSGRRWQGSKTARNSGRRNRRSPVRVRGEDPIIKT